MTAVDAVAAAVALVLVGLFGATVEWTRRATPSVATRVLITMSTVVTIALAFTLAMLAAPLVGRSDIVADRAHWSDDVFASGSRAGVTVSVLAALAIVCATIRVTLKLRERTRHKEAANRFRDEVGAAYGETIVAALDQPDAMALSSGVIVLTPSLIRALDPDQRRAVLAHERAHLDRRHDRYRHLAVVVAAANPLLRRLPDAIWYLTERWADEDAARATSRATTAAALKCVARITGPRIEHSLATMHSAVTGVPERILALEAGPTRAGWHRLVLPAMLVAAIVVVPLTATERTVDLFQLAHALGHITHGH